MNLRFSVARTIPRTDLFLTENKKRQKPIKPLDVIPDLNREILAKIRWWGMNKEESKEF
jgi:hypothetical protein